LRILFDYQIFTQQQFGGISRYFCALANQLAGHPDTWTRIVAPVHYNKYLAETGNGIEFGWYLPRVPRIRALSRAISSAAFTPAARRMRPDIVHETYYAARATYRAPVPRVLTVFDMNHEKLPGEFSASDITPRLKASAVQRADRIICISENTRRDLLETLSFPEDRVVVTHLGYDMLQPLGQTAGALVGAAPFILHVGARKGYKNFANLARAFAASNWLKNNFRIVCFGGRAFSSAERSMLAGLGLTETQVVQLAGGDDRLAALYKAAAAFVYPSKYEGFGIPPLEAMSLDCPVICSGASSIPEVVGEAGEYFDPNDVESMQDAVERVLQSADRRHELIALGRSRCQLFTWERCARETHHVYRTLAQ
jgi:glycosyltransferase involved in cell wall biosynthesis